MKGAGVQLKNSSSQHKTLKEWFSALSPKLQQLVREAEDQSWPFVFEEWQFEPDNKKEIVNINDLIQSKNSVYPDMTEEDVLKECLEHAYSEKAFETAASVALLLDRLMYLHGNSKYILDKVDDIKQQAPTTAIAPQVYLRKARFLKDGGSLQDADKTLDFILSEKGHKEQWRYKEESQYNIVHATCVQVKGVIRHNLGLWLEAADLILESIRRYNSLPKPDQKEISSSLGILSDVLRNISHSEFKQMLLKYACRYNHPLEEAYAANRQAAWLTRFDPFFFARHARRAGEVLLMFVITLPQEDRLKQITQALNDLKMSLKGHLSLNKLTSREQLNEFTCAVYQCFIAYRLMATPGAISKAIEIEKNCMVIYDHHCAATDAVPLEENFVKAIHKVHDLLELPRKTVSAPETNEFLNLPAYEYRYPTLRESVASTPNHIGTQVVSHPEDTANSRAPLSRFRTRVTRHATGAATPRKDNQNERAMEESATTRVRSISWSLAPTLTEPEADTKPSKRQPAAATPMVTEHNRSGTRARLTRSNTRANRHAIGSTAGNGEQEGDTSVADLSEKTTSISVSLSVAPTLMDPEADTRPSGRRQPETADSSRYRDTGIAVKVGDREGQFQQMTKSGGGPNEESGTPAVVRPPVASHCLGLPSANNVVETASWTGSLGGQFELPHEAATLADDFGVYASSEDTGYSGSTQGLMNPKTEDASIASHEQGVEIDEYVESVQPMNLEDKPTQLPQTFLVPDPVSPISSFVDCTLSALPGQTMNPSANIEMTDSRQGHALKTGEIPLGVHRARVFKFDAAHNTWTCSTTLVYVDDKLDVRPKGAMRDVIKLQYLNQDEPKARYVGKRYRDARRKKLHLYYQDVVCQMTARHFVALFNQALKDDNQAWKIQFVPAAHIQLLSDDHKDIVYLLNVEPFVEGSDFVKVTNNSKYVNPDLTKELVDVSLAFMHFTWEQSEGRILVTDLQGWLPRDQKGTIIFTDPAINSEPLKTVFVTGNRGKEGVDDFWSEQHPTCNDICYSLGIKRPQFAS
ncbi:alpha-protein kinase 1-like [Lineus longissimus]|uniref:alpha-protein kinase 1-like n=2 Tax=Lineus longissimus TaxID=88925 RepID=UPI00315CE8E0